MCNIERLTDQLRYLAWLKIEIEIHVHCFFFLYIMFQHGSDRISILIYSEEMLCVHHSYIVAIYLQLQKCKS
jgi:hypothetical protein